MIKLISGLLLSLASLCVQASFIPQHNPTPGGIAVVQLPESEQSPEVYFQKRRVMTVKHEQQWLAIVGLPLSLKSGEHQIQLKHPNTFCHNIPIIVIN